MRSQVWGLRSRSWTRSTTRREALLELAPRPLPQVRVGIACRDRGELVARSPIATLGEQPDQAVAYVLKCFPASFASKLQAAAKSHWLTLD